MITVIIMRMSATMAAGNRKEAAMYLEFYGLEQEPFNITPDPRFIFFSRGYREAYDHLFYGITGRKGFVALVGEVGCGKTTLCRAVLESLPGDVRTGLVLNPALTDAQLLRAVLLDFGLDVRRRDRLSYLQTLNEFLLRQNAAGCNVTLIIDEAQDLTFSAMEQIRLLNNLETDRRKLMQIVLAGQPELESKLKKPELRQLRQRIMVHARLKGLNRDETRRYLEHRLHVAGAGERLAFDSSAVRLIHRRSGGVPRLVNRLADAALMAAFLGERAVVTGREVRRGWKHLEGRE